MLCLIKHALITLLHFSWSSATKYVSFIIEQCATSHALIDLNPDTLNSYRFLIGLDMCNGSCNALDDLSVNIFIPDETSDVNAKMFGMITGMNIIQKNCNYNLIVIVI